VIRFDHRGWREIIMAKHEQPDKGWREWVLSLPIQMEANMTQTAGFEPGPRDPQPFSAPMSLVPNYDPIERLPPGGADRLRALRQHFHDTNKLIPKFEERHELSTTRIQAEQRLKRLLDHQSNGGFNLKPDDPRVIEQQRLLDKLTDDLRRLNELYETRTAAWHGASHVLSSVETWLKNGGVPPGVVLEDHAVDVPKLAKGESGLLDAIENRRRRVRELRADLHRIQSAPFPSSHAKAQMRAQIEVLSQQGAVNVGRLVEHDGQIEWPTKMLRSDVRGGDHPALAFAETHDAVPLLVWLHRDLLIKRLDQEIDSEADDKSAMSHEARQKATAEVMGDMLSVERDEAELTWKAQAERLPVEFRSDINPVALLGLRLVTAPSANPSPGTSPMHAWDFVGGRR
jgi:hypothetical protein